MRGIVWLLLSLLIAPAASAATFRVPSEYPTIQAGLDVASVGDTVLVGPGTYTSFTTVGQTNMVANVPDGVAVVGELGAAQTTIDLTLAGAQPVWSVAFSCGWHVSGGTVIDGFRVTGYSPKSMGVSIGSSATVRILNCIFDVEDLVPDGITSRGGIGSRQSDVYVSNCAFIRCSGSSGAAIRDNSGSFIVESCTFIECENQAISAYGDLGPGPRFLEVRDCLFERTFSNLTGGAIQAGDRPDRIIIADCEFRGVEATSNGSAIALWGPGKWQILNNLFVDINMQTGRNVVDLTGGRYLRVAGNTFAYCQQSAGSGVAISTYQSLWTFENNIFAHIYGGTALKVHFGPAAGCNVFWDIPAGVGYNLRPTDRIIDPLFCSPEDRNLTLDQWSPCLPANSLGCGLIGAFGQGCGSVSVTPTSWGRLKALYRN